MSTVALDRVQELAQLAKQGVSPAMMTTNEKALYKQLYDEIKQKPRDAVLDLNAFCPTGPGGGQDNSCSPYSTDSAAFKKWFGKSKVVDAQGNPLVVYHGTNTDFEQFITPNAPEDHISTFFFTPRPELAEIYVDKDPGGHIKPVYLSIQNPATMAQYFQGGPAELIKQGYDGIISPSEGIFVVFKSNQIKSATGNRGTFDTNDPSILNVFCPTGEGGGVDPTCTKVDHDLPAEPGTTPLPEGHIRLYHYTGRYIDHKPNETDDEYKARLAKTLKDEGLDITKAKGSTYGEPDVVWASTVKPNDQKVYAEFSIHKDDPRWQLGRPDKDTDPREYEKRGWDVTFAGSIKPEEIIAVHEPWHGRARHLLNNPEATKEAQAGKFDYLLDTPEYGPAVKYVKSLTKNTWTEYGSTAADAAFPRLNIFCKTGRGGGIDPTCKKDDLLSQIPEYVDLFGEKPTDNPHAEFRHSIYRQQKQAITDYLNGVQPIVTYTHGEYTVKILPSHSTIVIKKGDLRPVFMGSWMGWWDPDLQEVAGVSEDQYAKMTYQERAKADAKVQAVKYAAREYTELRDKFWKDSTKNAWCPTGPGGGKDNSCSPNGKRLPHSIEVVQIPSLAGNPRTVRISVNPGNSQVKTKITVRDTRGIVDAYGNVYVWASEEATHNEATDALHIDWKSNKLQWESIDADSGGMRPPQVYARLHTKEWRTHDYYQLDKFIEILQQAKDGTPETPPTTNVATSGKYSSTQVMLPLLLAHEAIKMSRMIDKDDLAEDGREDEPHITVKYGLHIDAPTKGLHDILDFWGPIKAKLGETSIFEVQDTESSRGGAKYDVVKIEVESDDLKLLNAAITKNIENTTTYPVYIPHVTLAYVKPGLGKKYAGMKGLAGTEVVFDSVVFSSKDQQYTVIPLTAPHSMQMGTRNIYCKTGPGGGVDPTCTKDAPDTAMAYLAPRAERARKSYNPCTKEKQRESDAYEASVSRKLRAKRTGNNAPMDMTIDGVHGIELKVLHDCKDGRVNMRRDSRRRKESWKRQEKGRTLHTVLIDNRDKFEDGKHAHNFSGHHIYYSKGVGAFKLTTMTKVESFAELKRIILESK
jgi:hypothetical protein